MSDQDAAWLLREASHIRRKSESSKKVSISFGRATMLDLADGLERIANRLSDEDEESQATKGDGQ